jgi:hypothetical protein
MTEESLENLHKELTGYISQRLYHEAQIRELQDIAEVLKAKEKIVLGKLCVRKSPVPAGKSPQKKKLLVCGINGCKYKTVPSGMTNHQKSCSTPMLPCTFCGEMGRNREVHLRHVEACKKKHIASTQEEEVIVPPVSTKTVDQIADMSFASSSTPL